MGGTATHLGVHGPRMHAPPLGAGPAYIHDESIESFELPQNEVIHIQNKNSFNIIRNDASLSKEASNEEMASQDF